MKDYKFRVWSKEDKRMIYLAKNESSDTHLQLNNHSWGVFEPDQEDYCGAASFNKHFEDILMQYIGVNDRNAREIYEGDVCLVSLKYFGIKNEKSKVIFKDGCFCFQFGCTNDYVKTYSAWDTNSVEVVGNIYENPELWKGE